jgi:hypothetical protein
MSAEVSASAAVAAVVALPHGLSRPLVGGVLVALIIFRRSQHDLAGAVTVRKRQGLWLHGEVMYSCFESCQRDVPKSS